MKFAQKTNMSQADFGFINIPLAKYSLKKSETFSRQEESNGEPWQCNGGRSEVTSLAVNPRRVGGFGRVGFAL